MNRRTVLVGIAVTAAATVIGVSTRYAPPEISHNSPVTVNGVENQTEDLSDAQDRSHDRMREDALDHGDAENAERLKAVIPRPPRLPR